jgi:ubiquinone/menaquinone biosynthesis C-methylase UbiE
MDKINIELTKKIVKENIENPNRYKEMFRRNKESFDMFKKWVKGPVLDVGCREGILLTILRKEIDSTVYGIDISEAAISQLYSNKIDNKVIGVVSDIEYMPFSDEYFNTIFALHVIEHCVNIDRAIKEIHRVLKKDRYVLVELPLQKKEPVPTKWGHWYCFENEQEILNKFNHLFKKVSIFKKKGKPWRRIVFKKI